MPRWRASSTPSTPSSFIIGSTKPVPKPNPTFSPSSRASTIDPPPFRTRIYRPDRDGAKSRLNPSTFSGEDQSPSPTRPDRLALLAEGLEPFLCVLSHREQCDLAFGVGDALVEGHRSDRAHGVFATTDRGRRLVDDAIDQPVDLGIELDRRDGV